MVLSGVGEENKLYFENDELSSSSNLIWDNSLMQLGVGDIVDLDTIGLNIEVIKRWFSQMDYWKAIST